MSVDKARGDLGLRLARGGGDDPLAQVQRIRLRHTTTPYYSPPMPPPFLTPESSYHAENRFSDTVRHVVVTSRTA